MPVTPLEPNDPQRLGEFVLTGRLGAGGMGVVYLGRGLDGALVAVKLVRSDLAHDPTFRERFRREVEALRRISGPRVAQLRAADTEAVQPFLVVEYVDGPTLANSVAANGPLAGDRLRALAAALAEAIVVIHEVGVIHRDLKPSNVILAADQPKLVDFGIAAAAGSMPLTMAGTVIGSAGWMAPEQAAGAVSTPTVDVFTWASLVAFAGTGRPPFGIGGPETVTARILNGEPDLDGLPQEVRPFVEAAFLKDPTRRPSARALLSGLVGRDEASTDELVEETTQLIEDTWVMPAGGWPAPADRTPVGPPPPPPPVAAAAAPAAPPPRPAPRRRWPIVVAALLVLLLVAVAVGAVLGGGDAGTPDTAADTAVPPATAATTPPTTAAPTTTTTIPPPTPVNATVQMEVTRGVLESFLDFVGAGSLVPCSDPFTLVAIEGPEGGVIEPPTAFPEGEQVDDGAGNVTCAYTIEFPGMAGADAYDVVISDDVDGELGRATVTHDELDASQGVIDMNLLFDVDDLFAT